MCIQRKLHRTTRLEKFWKTEKKLNCQSAKYNQELRQENFTPSIIVSSQILLLITLLWNTDLDANVNANQEDVNIAQEKDVDDNVEFADY